MALRMSAAGACRRQQGYEVLGYDPAPTPPERAHVMGLGDGVEQLLVATLRAQGYTIANTRWDGGVQLEVRLPDPPSLGHPDGKILLPDTDVWGVLECKGMNSYQYRRWRAEGTAQSHPQYLAQVHQYMAALALWDTLLVAMNRDTGDFASEHIPFNAEYYNALTSRLREAWAAISQGALPEPDYDGSTWHCSYCSYRALCLPPLERSASEPAVGTAKAWELPDGATLLLAQDLWERGKELETEGTALQEQARGVVQEAMDKHGLRRLLFHGLTAEWRERLATRWDYKALERLLTPEVLTQVRTETPQRSLYLVRVSPRGE